tara:strand:+ start:2100 stop:2927 length:828 start_codon:yes stop_codon:yes gene_type:complete
MYFSKCLELAETQPAFWANPNASAFDMFDSTQPDVFISHFKFLTRDIVKYLNQSPRKIEVILNMSGCTEEEMQMLDSITEDNKLKLPFVFTNMPDNIIQPKPKSIKLVNILPSVDIFMPAPNLPDYNIDTGIVCNEAGDLLAEVLKGKDNYHLMSLNNSSHSDLNVSIQSLRGLYVKYKEFILVGNMGEVYNQIMLEAMMFAPKTLIKVPREQEQALNKIFEALFSEDSSQENMSDLVRSQIKRKHTCVNRTARLCRFLKNNDAATKLEKIRDQL